MRGTLRAVIVGIVALLVLIISFRICLVWYRHAHPYLYAFGLGPTSEDIFIFALVSLATTVAACVPLGVVLFKKDQLSTPNMHVFLTSRAFFDPLHNAWISSDHQGRWYWYDGYNWNLYT